MRADRVGADETRVRARPLLAALVAASALAALVGASTTASALRACAGGSGAGGYSYAGHQASYHGHGVRATIALTRLPSVEAGHVAGWVGVGGPGQGPNGEDEWIQAGIAAVPGAEPFLYAEVARDGRAPEFVAIEDEVVVGVERSHRIAVLETSARPGWWRVWVDGQAATEPIALAGSSGRWAPIATAESWNAGTAACNAFAFRFERVSVSYGGGGSWRPFVSAHRFLDGTHRLHDLAAAPAASSVHGRTLASASVVPYAFVATSG
jgi:hypothetical protein